MITQHVSLCPFDARDELSRITITADILRWSNTLVIDWQVSGDLSAALIPGISVPPARSSKLWEHTCFELFLAVRNSPSYWEFNFSPAGHWNVYIFKAYREGMKEEAAFTEISFHVRYKKGQTLSCRAEIDLNRIVQSGALLEAAVSTVVRIKDGTLTYWAPTHGLARPDFHSRENFIVAL